MTERASFAGLATAMVLAACSEQGEVVEPAPRTIEMVQVTSGSTASAQTYPGVVRASERSSLAFEASGIITALNVDLGDTFAAGDTLGRVDDRQARLALDSALAQLSEAETERDDAKVDLDRRAALRGTGAIAPAAIDAAEARFDRANARVSSLDASVATARERIADTRLVAPFKGEVVARLREPSEIVSMGQPVLQVVGNGSALEVVTELPQRTVDAAALGDVWSVEASDGRVFEASVIEVGRDAGAGGLYPVTLRVETTDLRPGSRVSVTVQDKSATDGITIPLTSYLPGASPSVATVFVVDPSSQTVKAQKVQVGDIDDGGARILSGLEPGEQIALRGVAELRDGEQVQFANSAVARFNE
ncbi:MAG: efflux RND transporter periplasmic adaptor subunit [Pseudomonadota bacterium]